ENDLLNSVRVYEQPSIVYKNNDVITPPVEIMGVKPIKESSIAIESREVSTMAIEPMAVAPINGDAKILPYTDYGTKIYTYEKQSGTMTAKKYVVMKILGKTLGTVEMIVLELVESALSTIDYGKITQAETRYSFTYPGKQVSIYSNRIWQKRYEEISRYTWAHTWGYWTPKNSNYPKQYTISKTPNNGYKTPFKSEFSPNFTTDSTLIKRGRENYYMYDGYWKYPLYWNGMN
ncbi:hypothetical protein, partial [Streptomyces griseus]|uniref:hypothetical protein n=2 Tax=Bacillati TaxID=1783272 RepID=UPI0033E3413B